jgi:hypothetical protein
MLHGIAGTRSLSVGQQSVVVSPAASVGLASPLAGLAHSAGVFASFGGLTEADQAAVNGGDAASLEPPDQGLCASKSFVVEAVNLALRVYDTAGNALTNPVALGSFFGVGSGRFLSDPRCYYDSATNRFFLTVLEVTDPSADPADGSAVLIAVSQSSDPTGTWNQFVLDTTNDGGAGIGGVCPCLPDQPLIGADNYGFYVTTNAYGDYPAFDQFGGAQVYAMSKQALENGSPTAVAYWDSSEFNGLPFYSLQPASSPSGKDFSKKGTEYLLSSGDFQGLGDTQVWAWAIANTKTLANPSPHVTLYWTPVGSEPYSLPPSAEQQPGSTPFGTWGANHFFPSAAANQPVPTLDTGDDRMQQVVYAGGILYAGLNTAVYPNGVGPRAGIAWFQVRPGKIKRSGYQATVRNQGYIAVSGEDVMYPSIAVTPGGKAAVMSLTLTGPDYYPSAAYSPMTKSAFNTVTYFPGAGSADGFTGYDYWGGPPERWGDYSAAVATDKTHVWLATESIEQTCTLTTYQSDQACGNTRTTPANWATRITGITP